MSDRHDYLALDWVRGEIQETLNQAQQALEAFVESPEDATRMRFCQTHLHQVYGTLQMVEFYGAALLAEEMEALAQALLDNRVSNLDDGQETLMRAILQLPPYLDRVANNRRDLPVVLLPLLNDLRAVRGEALLSETALFKPDLSQATGTGQITDAMAEDPRFGQLAKKIRQMYQVALLGVLRNDNLPANLDYMAKVFAKLEQITGDAPREPLWATGGALIDGLQVGAVELGSSVKMVLGQVDRCLRELVADGAASLNSPAPMDLLKNLLYYVAKAESDSPRIVAVKERFQLVDALPSEDLILAERARMTGPDAQAMGSVVQALSEELTTVKDALEQFVHSGDSDPGKLQPQIDTLKQVADTVAVLGMGQPRALVQEQLGVMEAIVKGEQPAQRETLMDIAGALLYVEATLAGIGGNEPQSNEAGAGPGIMPGHVNQATDAVLRECRAGLEEAKDGIVEFIASQWDREHLEPVPERLNAVRGGLDVVQLSKPALILRQCVQFIEQRLLAGEPARPDWRSMDTLADAITSVEYYLERLSDDPETTDHILELARDSVAALGFPLAPESDGREGEEAASHDTASGDEEATPLTLDEPPQAVSAEPEPEPEQQPEPAPSTPADDDDLIDDEIIEIFQEEAAEVLDALDEYFPRWAANTADEDALVEFRRAFHTLKGSGRMVGASTVGELSWSVENMLNRVIDHTIAPSAMLIDLVQVIRNRIPALVDAFARRQANPYDVQPLADAADTLADGGQIDEIPGLEKDDLGQHETAPVATQESEDSEPDAVSPEHSDLSLSEEDMEAFQAADDEQDAPAEWESASAADVEELDISLEPASQDDSPPSDPEQDEEIELGLPTDAAGDSAEPDPSADLLADIPDLSDLDDMPVPPVSEPSQNDDARDPVLLEIFTSEAQRNLTQVDTWLSGLDEHLSEHPVDDEVHRALHTLKGSARMAEIEPMAELAEPAEKLLKDLISAGRPASRDQLALLRQSHDLIAAHLHQLDALPAHLPGAQALIQRFEQHQEQLREDDASPDPHILSVFLSEGMDLIVDAEILLEQWAEHPEHTDELIKLRDELQLLGGSADTAGLEEIRDLARALAACYSAVETQHLPCNERLLSLAHEGQDALVNMMDCLAAGQTVRAEMGLVDALHELSEQPDPDGPDGGPGGDRDASAVDTEADSAPSSSPPTDDDPYQAHLDPELVNLFLEEAEEILESASHSLERWQNGEPSALAGLQRDLHTLKGGARMAEVAPVADLAHELETLYEKGAADSLSVDQALTDLLHRCHDRLAEMIEALGQGQTPAAAPELVAAIQAFIAGGGDEQATPSPAWDSAADGAVAVEQAYPAAPPQPERDPELVEIFLEEADEILESAGNSLELWIDQPDNLIEVQSLQRDLHTLKGGARMAEVPELGDLGHELETLYEGLAQGQLATQPALFDLLHRCHDFLADMVDALKATQPLPDGASLIQAIHEYSNDPADFNLPPRQAAAAPAAPAAAETPAAEPAVNATDQVLPAEADLDILDIFLEESDELSELIDGCLTQWQNEPDSREFTDDLKRALHTLKGGARLAGLKQLGDLSHDFESYLLDLESQRRAPDDSDFQPMLQWHDAISQDMEAIRVAIQNQPLTETNPTAPPPAEQAASPAPAVQQPRRDDRHQRQTQAQPQEMVRVGADVLEALVNLAGETSINRGRVEQGISDFAFDVEEMGSTVQRLYDQLRRLDSETEAQILSNYQKGVDRGEFDEDFDPLEMDQYSELHQITKQLSESASDLLDLKNTLLDRNKDTETLLLQQARINTELQEKLMRTRMVPFSRLVPRLRRIVRQISGEVDKRVDFDVLNPEGELDRSLMERVVAPLEHMLRNAVDHGIEDRPGRRQADKAETGKVSLELTREGGEVVITLTDDGKGIDTDVVRQKAVERGLVAADAQLSDQEVQQFIFHAGFSTADQVTQISGRGVGMDVVASEIKQMGGSVAIDSHKGQGTRFIVRLPFTLAMNRALMVRVGEDSYAIPLNQVEGIVRVSPFELQHYFQEDNPVYTYVGQDYELQYLGNFVHGTATPNLDSTTPMPVMLIRSSEHSVAIVVDSLLGSREVVVKAVGPQLASIAGISGATILGDGSVVVILDIHSLIRAAHVQTPTLPSSDALPEQPQSTAEEEAPANPVVMVVDDSVTVRKVTGRLLERSGFDVVTAKDGMDALATLEDTRPDLMLLDIEMPRMDGFEVAIHMRHDSRLRDVPVIMITSRTGDKHRERAFDIGVDCYMGKPFQENELLSTIRELLGETQEIDEP